MGSTYCFPFRIEWNMAISHSLRKHGDHTVPNCQDIASNVEFA